MNDERKALLIDLIGQKVPPLAAAVAGLLAGDPEAIEVCGLDRLTAEDVDFLIETESAAVRPRGSVLKLLTEARLSLAETDETTGPSDAESSEPSEPQDDASFTVVNASPRIHAIGATAVKPGKSYTLTLKDRQDERLMRRVEYALKLGVLTRGAD